MVMPIHGNMKLSACSDSTLQKRSVRKIDVGVGSIDSNATHGPTECYPQNKPVDYESMSE